MLPEKLDPALQIALDSQSGPYTVFVHVTADIGEDAQKLLADLHAFAPPSSSLYVATLSAEAIDELSERDWVKFIRLARQLQPGE